MEFWANLFDSAVFALLVARWGEMRIKKSDIWKFIALTTGLLLLNIEMAGIGQMHFAVPMLVDLLIIFLTGRYLFRLTWQECLAVYILFYLVNFISVALAALIAEMFVEGGFEGWSDSYSKARLLYLIVAKLLLTMGIFILEVLRKKIFPLNRKLFLWVYMVLPFSVFAVCLYLIEKLFFHEVLDRESVMLVYLLILLLLFTVVFLAAFVACAEAEKREKRQLQELLQRERESLKRLIAYERKAAKFKHDLKNKMLGIEYLLKEGKVDIGIGKLEKMLQDYHALEYDFAASQYIWEIMIESKCAEEADAMPDMIREIDLKSLGKVDEVDFCVILGNLLDNAFEAVRDVENKVIRIVLTQDKGFIYLEIDNTYQKEAGRKKEGKVDRYVEHGFGMNNVQEIVKKYDGRFEVEKGDIVFRVRVLIPCI